MSSKKGFPSNPPKQQKKPLNNSRNNLEKMPKKNGLAIQKKEYPWLKNNNLSQIVGYLNGKPVRSTKDGAVPCVVMDKNPSKKRSMLK